MVYNGIFSESFGQVCIILVHVWLADGLLKYCRHSTIVRREHVSVCSMQACLVLENICIIVTVGQTLYCRVAPYVKSLMIYSLFCVQWCAETVSGNSIGVCRRVVAKASM